MTEPSVTDSSFNSQHRLAVAAMVLLAIFLFASIPLVGTALTNVRVFQVLQSVSPAVTAVEPGDPGGDAALVLRKGLQTVAAVSADLIWPAVLVGVVAAVVALIWLFRVHENLPALGARNLKYTPLWAVGWWFIPFAHFVRPYQIMHEIWQGSDPGGGEDPELRVIGPPSALIGWWWALVVSTLVLRFYYPMWASAGFARGDLFGVGHYLDVEFYYVEAASAAVSIGAALLAIAVVFSIDRMQSEKHRLTTATATPAPETTEAPSGGAG